MVLNCIYVADTEKMGKGVFTSLPIDADEIVEISDVIIMSAEDKVLLNKTQLKNYIFDWGYKHEECCMALGNVPIYNHSAKANCEYTMDYELKVIIIKSTREIKSGEELFINYNGDWNNENSVWFDTE